MGWEMVSIMQGWACGSGSPRPKVRSFKDQYDAVHELCELNERWNNRISSKIASLGKLYIEGRLSIICYASWNSEASNVEAPSSANGNLSVEERIAIIIYSADPRKLAYRDSRNEELMLVDVVELPEFPECKTTSLIRAYLVKDNCFELRSGFHYQSQIFGLCYTVPRFVLRELNSVAVSTSGSCDLVGDVVEGDVEVVDCISDDHWDFGWQRLRLVPDVVHARLRVRVHPQTIEVRFEEGAKHGLQLVDVAYGPIDL